AQLTRRPGPMTRKRKRRSNVVEIGNGPARVKIYTVHRKDGYGRYDELPMLKKAIDKIEFPQVDFSTLRPNGGGGQ
ncbi:MAG: hypothetical protein WCP45_08655, partial [Verrucomicrobiota bacterium]